MSELLSALDRYSLPAAFAFVALLMGACTVTAKALSGGRVHGSAVAIVAALALAGVAGWATGGDKGLADVAGLSGLAVLGGAALRDLAIVATAFGVDVAELKKAGAAGVAALVVGLVVPFVVGALAAYATGYRSAADLTTIGAGAATYIVGPVTGEAVGASPAVQTVAFAAGLIKSILTMVVTPWVAPLIGLDNPRSAVVFGGLVGTTSGVAGGLAATDERLVPYGAMTATFYTGLGCLAGPSVAYWAVFAAVGA